MAAKHSLFVEVNWVFSILMVFVLIFSCAASVPAIQSFSAPQEDYDESVGDVDIESPGIPISSPNLPEGDSATVRTSPVVLSSSPEGTTDGTTTAITSLENMQIADADGISLTLDSSPDFITPGGSVTIHWQVGGMEVKEGLEIVFYLPAGIEINDSIEGIFDADTLTYRIMLTALNGEFSIRLPDPLDGPYSVDAVLFQDGEAIAKTFLTLEELFVVDKKGGEIDTLHGKVHILVPDGALTESIGIKVHEPGPDKQFSTYLNSNPFEIVAQGQETKAEVRSFSKPITIEVSYDEQTIRGSEADLSLFWYDTASQEWRPLLGRVDTNANVIIAQTNHLTSFAFDVQSWQASHLPTLEGFQVSNFTGAATYSMPLEVPTGPGGLQPDLTLSYSSQIVDGK